MAKHNATPNILIIMADQLPPQFLGAYGHPTVKSPHIDALARTGARFDAAYCNAPLCAPSRYAFMSGLRPTRIGAYDNASEFPSSIPTFAHFLTQMGYRSCLAGKMHFVGPDQRHGFQERITTDIYPADFAWTPDWETPGERIGKWYHNMDSVLEAGVAATTFQIEYDEEVAFYAKRKIFEFAKEKAEPFCLVASFIHPHDPYVTRDEWWALYAREKIDLPVHVPPFAEQDAFSQRLMEGIEANKVAVSDDQVCRARRAYFANTSYVDSKVGELMAALEEAGLQENTVIMFTSDHGDMLGERGLWYKMHFFEHSARVPLILSGPQVRPASYGAVCSLIDIAPTLLDIAAGGGTPQPLLTQDLDGRSLWPLVTARDGDRESDRRREAIGEYCAEMTSNPVFMIRRGDHKFIHCESDPPLLFDLKSDPQEKVNLASKSDFDSLRESFVRDARARWDSEKIRQDVILSQKRRHAIHAAATGTETSSWDYNPPRDAAREYVRNHLDWPAAAAKSRFPPIGQIRES